MQLSMQFDAGQLDEGPARLDRKGVLQLSNSVRMLLFSSFEAESSR